MSIASWGFCRIGSSGGGVLEFSIKRREGLVWLVLEVTHTNLWTGSCFLVALFPLIFALRYFLWENCIRRSLDCWEERLGQPCFAHSKYERKMKDVLDFYLNISHSKLEVEREHFLHRYDHQYFMIPFFFPLFDIYPHIPFSFPSILLLRR